MKKNIQMVAMLHEMYSFTASQMQKNPKNMNTPPHKTTALIPKASIPRPTNMDKYNPLLPMDAIRSTPV